MSEKKEWTWEGDDGETVVRTCAWSPPGCHPVGCGLLLHVKDGKLVKVEGDPEHPITKGALCPRCLALADYVYHPDRIIYPMKRAKEDRGKDKWERITWDEAYDTIVAKTKEITEKYGAETIAVFGGTGRVATLYYPIQALVVFGTPNAVYGQSGMACYYPRGAELGYMAGPGYPEIDYACRYPDRYDHEGWEAPEYILIWGKEPLKSNPDGLWGHAIIDMMRFCGTKLICVDPRITWLGTRAEINLQLRPGTDGAVALAMVGEVVREDLYDHDFTEKWCYGFDEYAERVKTFTCEWAAEISGVPAELIREAALKFGKADRAALCWGLAIDQNPNGPQVAQALIGMLAITGNLDAPGGCTLGMIDHGGTGASEEGVTDEENYHAASGAEFAYRAGIMTPELWDKRIGAHEHPGVCDYFNQCHPDSMLDTLETGKPYQMRMAYFQSSNVADGACTTAPQRWREALKKLDFMFCSDTFMNATAMALCDIFLPLATFAETDGFVQSNYGLNTSFNGAINKAITVGECKDDLQITLDLGKRLQPEFWNRYKDEHDYLEKVRLPHGYTWERFRDEKWVMPKEIYKKYEKGLMREDGQPGFNTPTGRVELWCNGFASHGDDPLPYYIEPPYSPVSTPDVAEEYPLVLTTGARTYVTFHSEHRQIKSLREMHPWPLLEINPKDAEELGIKDGEWVFIETQWGKVTQKAHVCTTTLPGTVHAEHAWWYPEKDPEEPVLYGSCESNINAVMPNHVVGKLGFGNTFKCQMCKVYKNPDRND